MNENLRKALMQVHSVITVGCVFAIMTYIIVCIVNSCDATEWICYGIATALIVIALIALAFSSARLIQSDY